MKNAFRFIIPLLLAGAAATAQTAQKEETICYNPNLVKDTSKKSIKSMAVGVLGRDSVKINYHSPGVRGRIIWGGLVPLNEVWVTGAHDATTIEIATNVIIGGREVPAGKYALFTIPGKDEWTVILNKHWKQHLATEYDAKDDMIRLNVKPRKNKHAERLQYLIEPAGGRQARIAMIWETVRIEFPITVKA